MLQTFLKYSIIRFSPSSSSTVGCQPNFSLANVISGWRCFAGLKEVKLSMEGKLEVKTAREFINEL